MPSADHARQVYEDLAHLYERQGQAKQRDWFLVLAADKALSAGRADDAERLRGRLLHLNPHHLLRPFDSFADALKSPDVQGYVADLRRIYPPDAAAQLLNEQRQGGAGPEPEAKRARTPDKANLATGPLGQATAREDTDVQVFRLGALADEVRSTPPPRPAAPPPAPKKPVANVFHSTPAERPAPPPRPRLSKPAPAPWTTPPVPARGSSAAEEERDPMSAWVALVLFLLLLLAGLGLAGYVFVRPLLLGRFF